MGKLYGLGLVTILLLTVGCSTPETHFASVGTTYLSFNLPSEWKEHRENQWYDAKENSMNFRVLKRSPTASYPDLENRASQFGKNLSPDRLNLIEANSIRVGQQPGYIVEYESHRSKQPVYYLFWEEGDSDFAFYQLNGAKNDKVLRMIAASIVPTSARTYQQEAEVETSTQRDRGIPPWVYQVFLVFLFSGVPAAFGASASFQRPNFSQSDRNQLLSHGAFLPTFLGTLTLYAGLGIWFFSELKTHQTGNISQLAMIAFAAIFFVLVLGVVLISLLAGLGASWGARIGASRGQRTCMLYAMFGAILGAGLIPILRGLN